MRILHRALQRVVVGDVDRVRVPVDLTRDRTMRISSSIGIDATRPFGETFYEVADVPGWEDFDVPELDKR